MMRFSGNFHTHSRWCRHGCGEFEEYIHAAIDRGFSELAFTEHVPQYKAYSWIDPDLLDEFDAKLNAAIDRYGDQLKIYKGFECEYYEESLDYYRMLIEDYGYTHMLLGQHYSGKDHMHNQFEPKGEEAVTTYTEEVIKGMESGLFYYIAHPDLLLHKYVNGYDKLCESCLDEIFQCASENNIIVEINAGGVRANRPYPSREAFLISKKYPLKYVVGADAHDPRSIGGDSMYRALDFANSLDIKLENVIYEENVKK